MSIYKKNQPKVLPILESPYKKRLIEIAKLAKYEPVASIPSINNDFNYTYAKEGHLKRKQRQQVSESRQFSPKPEPRHSPNGHLLPRIDSKPNKIEYHPTNTSQQQHLLTLDTRVETQDFLKGSNVRSISPFNTPNIKNNRLKDNNRRQRYKINEMQPQEQQSQDQYQTDATPGPGYYSVCDNSSIHNRSRKGRTDFSFGSKDQRFKQFRKPSASIISEKISQSQEKLYERRQIALRRRKIVPFLSCSFKNDLVLKQKIPGPQDYHPRHGIEQELIRKIQRNFKGNFGVCEKRFSSDDKNTNLGPGSYKIDVENSQNNSGSYYFKSQIKRFE